WSAGEELSCLPRHHPPRAPGARHNYPGEVCVTESTGYILLWILIFTVFGCMIGWVSGQMLERSHCAEERVEELRQQLNHASLPNEERQLREIRSILNDVHKHIRAVSKGLEKPAR